MTLEDIVEREAIKALKYKYMRIIDQKLWDIAPEVFTEHATSSYGGGSYSQEGRDAICAFLEKSMGHDGWHSSHRVHQPEIELLSDTTAKACWAFEDYVIDEDNGFIIRGAGFYYDDYVKVDGEWKIQHTGYIRTFEEMQPRKEMTGIRLTASHWKTGGASHID